MTNSTIGEPSPYTDEDIFRESSEGRSLHDDANVFCREVMRLTTPIKSTEQPIVVDIQDAISKKVSKTDLRMWNIIYALQLTKEQELWPGTIQGEINNGRANSVAQSTLRDVPFDVHYCLLLVP